MKYITLLILFISVLLSCKKEEVIPPLSSRYYGGCSATKDGVVWKANTLAGYDTLRYKREAVCLFAQVFEKGILKETLAFTEVPLKKGVYSPMKKDLWDKAQHAVGAVYFIEEENGHVVGTEFLLDTLAKTNKFEVVDFNAVSKEIKVKFTATFFIKDRSKAHIIDTIRFTNGEILTRPYN
jgi:hypothetical protein